MKICIINTQLAYQELDFFIFLFFIFKKKEKKKGRKRIRG
jgi:hypothetical protein